MIGFVSHEFECNLEYMSTSNFFKDSQSCTSISSAISGLKYLRVLNYFKIAREIMRLLVNNMHAIISLTLSFNFRDNSYVLLTNLRTLNFTFLHCFG